MSLQQILNQQAIDMLPKIKEILSKADTFEYSQIYARTLKEISSSSISLTDMSAQEITSFEKHLIDIFKYFRWI